jgi:hypothetical protein
LNNNNDKIDDNDDQHMKSKIIKCKTNNQQSQISAYNILTPNGSSSTTIRSIDVPNEHASIKLHIRRVCSPSSSTETLSIHPTTNLLFQPQQSIESNEQPTPKIIPRKFFHTNDKSSPNNTNSRRMITTRRTSLIESDLSHITSSIYDLPKPTILNHNNIYDENTLKKQKINGYKRKSLNEQQEKKRQKLTTKPIKQQQTNNTSTSSSNFFSIKVDDS